MASTKQVSSTCGKTDDDIFIENFARDFFGTNEPDNESSNSLPEKAPVTQADDKEEKRAHEEVYTPKMQAAYKKKSERKVENQRNASKDNYKGSSHIVYPNNARQSPSIKRFLQLRDEFLSLSDRLHDASLHTVSKKLTQALTERQKLVKELLDVNDLSSSSNFGHRNEEMRLHDQSRSKNLTRSTERECGMPKKTKSVHWSDEHLGGSIILDPSLYAHQINNSKSNSVQVQTPERHKGSSISKPPPSYKTVDRCTQTRSGRKKTENRNMKIDLELEYVEAILNEAAELRREACGMIWRAHYLEQLCDVDGLVKHVYRSTSNVPTVPRYPHLYR